MTSFLKAILIRFEQAYLSGRVLQGFYLLGYGAFFQSLLDTKEEATEAWEKVFKGFCAPKFKLQRVPRTVELSSFDSSDVKLLSNSRLENGFIDLSNSSVWLQKKVRIAKGFRHSFSFQEGRGGRSLRLALIFQPSWSPQARQ